MTLPNQFDLQCLFFCDVLHYVSSVYMQESTQVLSPWSESMTQLIQRLDQLNLDIEEALSAGSSPSDTPNTARRHTANDRAFLQVTLIFFLVKYNVIIVCGKYVVFTSLIFSSYGFYLILSVISILFCYVLFCCLILLDVPVHGAWL